jgi:hypothetical protein
MFSCERGELVEDNGAGHDDKDEQGEDHLEH